MEEVSSIEPKGAALIAASAALAAANAVASAANTPAVSPWLPPADVVAAAAALLVSIARRTRSLTEWNQTNRFAASSVA
jgi:hypothetical protein